MSTKVALAAHGKMLKTKLTENPFYRDFDYGKSRGGHWDGNHASAQLEDCADVFCTIFDKQSYLLVFELDHSQAHE